MILPVGVSSFKEAMRAGSEVYHNLKSIIKKKYGQDAVNVGDEGGFAPNVKSAEEALGLIKDAIEVRRLEEQISTQSPVPLSPYSPPPLLPPPGVPWYPNIILSSACVPSMARISASKQACLSVACCTVARVAYRPVYEGLGSSM